MPPQARHDKEFESEISVAPAKPQVLLIERIFQALRTALQNSGDRISQRHSGFTADQLRNPRQRVAVQRLLSAVMHATLDMLAVDTSARRELNSLNAVSTCDSDPVVCGLASLVATTPSRHVRRACLEVLAGTLSCDQADAALRQAEYRATRDDHLIGELSERTSVSTWQKRLLHMAANNDARGGMGKSQHRDLRVSFEANLRNGTVHEGYYACRVSKVLILQALCDIELRSELGWSWQRRLNPLTLERGSYLYRTMTKKDLYQAYCDQRPNASDRVGRATFSLLTDAATKRTEATSGISYWIADVNAAVALLETITVESMTIFLKLKARGGWVDPEIEGVNAKHFAKCIKNVKRAVDETFYRHARKPSDVCDGDACHCTLYGMSNCALNHTLKCKDCTPAFIGPVQITKALDNLIASINRHRPSLMLSKSRVPFSEWTAYDELVSMKGAIAICALRIRGFHAHILRARWQHESIKDLLESLADDTILIDFDWMMKVGQNASMSSILL